MAHGGHGCISVTANVAPRACADFQKACLSGDYVAALAIQDRLWALHSNLFIETSPAPVKYAASLLDLCTPDVRLPLVPIGTATEQKVRAAMELAGLFS
jgi:4-hydroxy-tetrahydrodipicolinate synthase